MRKVVSSLMISLDGVVESPDQWTFDFFNEDLFEEMVSQLDEQDTVLMGRVSYEEWAGYWPTSKDEPFATFINNIPKYVVSSTLKNLEWQNSLLLEGDLEESLVKLKEQPGKKIGVQASISLVESLVAKDLLDELHLTVFPVIAGKGKRLFENGLDLKRLKLVSSKTSSLGVLMLAYELEH